MRQRAEAGEATGGARQRAGRLSMSGGADVVVVTRFPPAAVGHREEPGHAVCLPHLGGQCDLLSIPLRFILLEALSDKPILIRGERISNPSPDQGRCL